MAICRDTHNSTPQLETTLNVVLPGCAVYGPPKFSKVKRNTEKEAAKWHTIVIVRDSWTSVRSFPQSRRKVTGYTAQLGCRAGVSNIATPCCLNPARHLDLETRPRNMIARTMGAPEEELKVLASAAAAEGERDRRIGGDCQSAHVVIDFECARHERKWGPAMTLVEG
jgi:hypothetical protein